MTQNPEPSPYSVFVRCDSNEVIENVDEKTSSTALTFPNPLMPQNDLNPPDNLAKQEAQIEPILMKYSGLAVIFSESVEELPPSPRLARVPWWLNPLAVLVLLTILAYQLLIPNRVKRQCIYTPTCSRYCQRAIQKYGLLRGLFYFWNRWRRCNGAYYLGGEDHP